MNCFFITVILLRNCKRILLPWALLDFKAKSFKTCGKLLFETMNHRDAMFAKCHITHLSTTNVVEY